MRSVAYSADGSRLARAEGNAVVVCDAVSGFEVHRLRAIGMHAKKNPFNASCLTLMCLPTSDLHDPVTRHLLLLVCELCFNRISV